MPNKSLEGRNMHEPCRAQLAVLLYFTDLMSRHPCHGQRAAVNHEVLLFSGFLGRAECVSNALHRRYIPHD